MGDIDRSSEEPLIVKLATRAMIEKIISTGDVMTVHYISGGIVAKGIELWTGGAASHALCAAGGIELVEDDIGGVMHTFIDNYLRGKCRLTLRRPRVAFSPDEQERIRAHWLGKVGQDYGFGSIKRALISTPIRRFIEPVFPRTARILLRLAGSLLGHALPDCSALWVEGVRVTRPWFMGYYDAEEVTPEMLLNNEDMLYTVAIFEGASIVEEKTS